MSAMPLTPEIRFRVPVRELCEFTAKRGDLDHRFTPSPTAHEGIAGHSVVAARRGPGYTRELTLTADHQALTIRGRADGFDATANVLEEVKTYRGDLARQPNNHRQLHWAQLKVYGAMLCGDRGLADINLRLTYYEISQGTETAFTECWTARALQSFFEEQATAFVEWAQQELRHRERRGEALAALRFPHTDFNPGQRKLSIGVYKAAVEGRTVLVEAPTGIGKTVGTIFPALKAAAVAGAVDKIFYLTAKTSGRQLALDALRQLGEGAETHNLRVVELTSREKMCVHPGASCHGESCPLAKGFYDRLATARKDAVVQHWLDQVAIRRIAEQHAVCPYYLSQELVRWADVVVADYNYYFDQNASLHALTVINDWKVVLLVDESHNLIDRGRAMYSASLEPTLLDRLRRLEQGPVRRTLDRLNRVWNRLHRDQVDLHAIHDAIPEELLDAVRNASAQLGESLAEEPQQGSADLQMLFFDLTGWLKLAEQFGKHSLFIVELQTGRQRRRCKLTIHNVIPAAFIGPRLASAKAAVLFTATLGPSTFFREMVGIQQSAVELRVPSPFQPEQLEVRIVDTISTRFPDRARSVPAIADTIIEQHRRRPGNYLAFFSSYAYLEAVRDEVATRFPTLQQWSQSSGMTESERDAFLDRFAADGQGVGFAVLGGAFAEGIDLPGTRLIGAFIATLGLPQINAINDSMRQRVAEVFGRQAGYDYVYLFPGLRKVVQAAGRIIRTRSDQGVVHLIDDRFKESEIRALLPDWWVVERSESGRQQARSRVVSVEVASATFGVI